MNLLALRKALHLSVDLVLDALAAEPDEQPKRRRAVKDPVPLAKTEFTPEELEAARKRRESQGFRKTG